jgi:hypothetical protein
MTAAGEPRRRDIQIKESPVNPFANKNNKYLCISKPKTAANREGRDDLIRISGDMLACSDAASPKEVYQLT